MDVFVNALINLIQFYYIDYVDDKFIRDLRNRNGIRRYFRRLDPPNPP